MDKQIIKFNDTEIQFHQYKKLISIENKSITKIVVFKKVPLDKKDFTYFICYNDARKIDLYPYSFQK